MVAATQGNSTAAPAVCKGLAKLEVPAAAGAAASCNAALYHIYEGVLGPYWDERKRLADKMYKGAAWQLFESWPQLTCLTCCCSIPDCGESCLAPLRSAGSLREVGIKGCHDVCLLPLLFTGIEPGADDFNTVELLQLDFPATLTVEQLVCRLHAWAMGCCSQLS